MAIIDKSMLIGYSSRQMFDLVEDVEHYPEFLPWCEKTLVEHRDEQKTVATLYISYRGVKANFTTENEKEAPHLMRLKLRDGPMRRLEGVWQFKPLSETACKIIFQLHYEFPSKLIDSMISPVFTHIGNTLADAFVKRAEEVYGRTNV